MGLLSKRTIQRWAVLLLSCFPVASFAAGTRTIEVNAIGFGASRNEAIRAGLSSAVGQVNGTSLSATEQTESATLVAASANAKGELSTSNMEINVESSAATKTSGQIDSYDILSVSQTDDGNFKAELKVRVFRYDTPASSSRNRLALLVPESKASSYSLFGRMSTSTAKDALYRAIEQHLVQTRKFAVLSRNDLDAVSNELALIASDATSRQEKAKLGRVLGADFILLPEIISASGATTSETVKITGQVKTSSYGKLVIGVKVLAAATGEIKYSEQFSATTSRSRREPLFQAVANKAIDGVVEQIYPKRIVKATAGKLIINAGGKGVQLGQHYDAYAVGELIVDPYTGESLGGEETKIGTVKITKVLPKMSYAAAVTGSGFESGMVLRKSSYRGRPAKPEAASTPAKPAAGFSLPFD